MPRAITNAFWRPPRTSSARRTLTWLFIIRIETATRGEWEEFESAYGAELEEWLLDHPDHSHADEVRTKVNQHRDIWLRGHRDVMGFAYLTLGVPVSLGGVQVDGTDRP